MSNHTIGRDTGDLRRGDDQAELCEGAYRRGVHQALAFAADLGDRAVSLGEFRRLLTRAENIAGDLRFLQKHRGRGMLLDEIGVRLFARRRKVQPTEVD